MAGVAPVLSEMARKKIERAVRDGRPFNLKKLSEDAELVALALNCAPEPEDRLNKPLNEYLNLVLNQQLRKKKLRTRFSSGTTAPRQGRACHSSHAFMLYPSNDPDRFHLKDNEVSSPPVSRRTTRAGSTTPSRRSSSATAPLRDSRACRIRCCSRRNDDPRREGCVQRGMGSGQSEMTVPPRRSVRSSRP